MLQGPRMTAIVRMEQALFALPDQLYDGDSPYLETLTNKFDASGRARSLQLPARPSTNFESQFNSHLSSPVESPPQSQASPLKDEYMNLDSIPKTPERDIGQESPNPSRPRRDPRLYFAQAISALRTRKETIFDDAPWFRRSNRLGCKANVKRIGQNCVVSCTPPRRRFGMTELELERSTEKRLREVPSSAPRLVETKGKYTFRKGVRIREYRMPLSKVAVVGSGTSAYQCRDRFERREVQGCSPQTLKAKLSEEQGRLASLQHSDTAAPAGEPQEVVPPARQNANPYSYFGLRTTAEKNDEPQSVQVREIKDKFDEEFEQWLAQGTASCSGDFIASIENN